MMNLREKSMTKLSLVVTFAVLLGACTSKSIKMEASEMALETGDTEQVQVGDSTQLADDGYMEIGGSETPSFHKTAKKAKRKGLKSKAIAFAKKSKKSLLAKDTNVSAAATVAKEVEAPKTLDQEISKYPSMDNLNGISVPSPMEEASASMVEEGSGRTFWMYVLAGFLFVFAIGGYVYRTRFSKSRSKRRLVYNG